MHRIVYSAVSLLLNLQVSVVMAHTLFHANIKDLRTSDIRLNGLQMRALKDLIMSKGISPDVVNLQEIQYDLENGEVPLQRREGQNLANLLALTWPDLARDLQTSSIFVQANTGKLAHKDDAGRYCLNKEPSNDEVNEFADQQNFGLFPGQYSSFIASSFGPAPGEKPLMLRSLKWREFNQNIDLTQFSVGNGKRLNPDVQLFDKVLYSLPVQLEGRLVYLVSLHTVPYFHFGNDHTPNYARNFDQLRFLSWYLHSDAQGLNVDEQGLWERHQIKPLPKNTPYVVIGDLNVDINDEPEWDQAKAYHSAKVLEKIIEMSKLPFDRSHFTFDSGRLKKFFDYVIFSKHFELSNPVIWNHSKFAKAGELSDHFALTVDFFLSQQGSDSLLAY